MAAQQPNFQILSDSLIAAGQQASLIPNLPAFDHGRQLRDQLAAFQRGMDEQFRLLRVELQRGVDEQFRLNQRFTSLELSMKAEARNQAARVFNSHVTSVETKLHALYNSRNEAIEGFPEDLATLEGLNANLLTALLNACELATDGTVQMKKRRFRLFIGAVINA